VAILSDGVLRMHGTLGAVRGDRSLEEVFVQVVGGRIATGSELAWL
jgi:ABC-2 type transport system ATP-binding protein